MCSVLRLLSVGQYAQGVKECYECPSVTGLPAFTSTRVPGLVVTGFPLPPLQYASRVRTIKNEVSKNENSKEMLKLKKMVSEGMGPPAELHCLSPVLLLAGSIRSCLLCAV